MKNIIGIFMAVLLSIPAMGQIAISPKGDKITIDSSKWKINGSNIYLKTAGSVGIGQTDPKAKLDIDNGGSTTLPALKIRTPFVGTVLDDLLTWNRADSTVRKLDMASILVPISYLASATKATSINHGGYTQTWTWNGATTQPGLSLGSTTLTTASLLTLTGAATLTSGSLLDIVGQSTAATTAGLLTVVNTAASSSGIVAKMQANSNAASGMNILANGNVGIGTTTPFATLTNTGSTAFASKAIGDLAAGGDIGAASATVDSATSFSVSQITAGQTLSLPLPTVSSAGRVAYVYNTGSTPFTMLGASIPVGQGISTMWTGAAWARMDASTSSISLSSISPATATGTIDNLAQPQTWNWSTASTQSPFTLRGNALTSGSLLTLSGGNALTSGALLNVSGAATSATSAGLLNVANTGTTSSGTVARIQSNSNAASGLTVLANGNVGVGTTAPFTAFTNNGTTAFSIISIGNLASGGVIGTAAATVDSGTNFSVTQTTSGQTITLPSPTITTAGRIAYVNNTGTVAFTMFGALVSASEGVTCMWNGTAWTRMNGSPTTIPISSIDAATSTASINNLNYAQTWSWSTATTQTPLTLSGTAITTGNLLKLTGAGTLTSGSLLNASAALTASTSKGILNINNTAGSTTGTVARIQSNSTATSGLTVLANGNVGIGTITPYAAFTNTGTTAFTPKAIADLATGGAIGTAVATVDSSTNFNITQTTTGQTLSLPSPTVTTAGRIAYVNNTGTAPFTMLGSSVPASQGITLMWTGAAWTRLNASAGSSSPAFSSLTAATGSNTIDNLNQAQTWNWSTADAQNPLALNGNALTTGNLITLNGTSTLTSGSLLNIHGQVTAATASGLLNVTNASAASAGTVAKIQANTNTESGLTILANGNIGIGTSTPFAGLTNYYATAYIPKAIANLSLGGAIGTANATVDSNTAFNITQSTSSQTLTLPSPTVTNAGRIVYINNTGSVPFTMLGAVVPVSQGITAMWNGTAWTRMDGSSTTAGALSSLSAATATNTIDNLNYAQTWSWSTANTQTPLTLSGTALTTGNLLKLTGAGTLTSGSLLNASAALTSSATKGIINIANTASSTTGIVARIQANSTATSGITAIANGNVGVGTTNPTFTTALNSGSTAPTLGVDGTVTANNYTTTVQTLTDATTIVWDVSKGASAVVTLAGTGRTLSITNVKAGMYGTLIVKQDATGSRTITVLPTNSKVINGGGGVPSLTPTALAVDVLSFLYDGTNYWWGVGNNYN